MDGGFVQPLLAVHVLPLHLKGVGHIGLEHPVGLLQRLVELLIIAAPDALAAIQPLSHSVQLRLELLRCRLNRFR